MQIPRSVLTSAAGFVAALCGWIAMSPGVHPVVATIAGFLAAGAGGAGLHFAADHRAVKAAAATELPAGACPTCGRPVDTTAATPVGGPPDVRG
jgi:hypothetical protein